MVEITERTGDMIKFLLKDSIRRAMEIDNKEDRLAKLPHIYEGIDLFELKKR